jgi:hypothetical protein
MHLLVRLSIRGLRVLQGRRLRSANSRFPCVDLVTLRSSPYSIIDFSCQYSTNSWTMVLHDRFAHNHVLRVHCLTFRRRLLLCLVKSPRSRALSDADGPWMEKVSFESCSDHFLNRHQIMVQLLNHNLGQVLCAICLMPHGHAVRITPSGGQTRPINNASTANIPDYPLLSSRLVATNGNLFIDGIDSYSGTSTSNKQVRSTQRKKGKTHMNCCSIFTYR